MVVSCFAIVSKFSFRITSFRIHPRKVAVTPSSVATGVTQWLGLAKLEILQTARKGGKLFAVVSKFSCSHHFFSHPPREVAAILSRELSGETQWLGLVNS